MVACTLETNARRSPVTGVEKNLRSYALRGSVAGGVLGALLVAGVVVYSVYSRWGHGVDDMALAAWYVLAYVGRPVSVLIGGVMTPSLAGTWSMNAVLGLATILQWAAIGAVGGVLVWRLAGRRPPRRDA